MERINFEDGQLVNAGYVEIDGVKHPITEAEYSGDTSLSAYMMNKLQDNIEDGINSIDGGDTLPVGTIVDYDGDTVPDGYEEVEDEGEIYSTEEQVIGTWIDGKPLYRKVIEFSFDKSTDEIVSSHISLDNEINEIISTKGKFVSTNSDITFYYNSNSYYSSTEFCRIYYVKRNTGNYLYYDFCNGHTNTTVKATIVLEYTKTTD